VSAQAIVCNNCGAGLEPKALESKVKCNYCQTVYVVTRDHEGISGLAADGATPAASATPASTNASANASTSPIATGSLPPAGANGAIAQATGLSEQTVERIERDAMLVVGGIVAAEANKAARTGSCALFFALGFLASSFVLVECARLAWLG